MLLGVLCGSIVTATSAFGQGGPPPTPVAAGEVVVRELQDRQRVTGEVRAVARVHVAAQESGVVLETRVDAGDRVEAGAVLAKLDDARLRLDAAQLSARLVVAAAVTDVRKAELEQAQNDLSLLEQLAGRDAINPKELADARSTVAIAAARVAEAEADLAVTEAEMAVMRRRLEDMVIRAPFTGIVLSRRVDVGGWIGIGDAVAELVTDGLFDVMLDVPQSLVSQISKNAGTLPRVTLEVAASGVLLVDQNAVTIPSVDPVARTFRARVRVVDEERRLADGMSATGWVPSGTTSLRLVIPRDALLENPAGFFVYAVRTLGEGPPQAVPVQVRLRFSIEGGVVVESADLREGEQVVTEGNERLFPMMPVRVVSPGATGGGA